MGATLAAAFVLIACTTDLYADTPSDPCAPPLHVSVLRSACKFGTADARISVDAGTQLAWTITGGTLLSANDLPTVRLGFGGNDHAELSVRTTARGCTATDTVTIALRDPLDIISFEITPQVPAQDAPAVLTWSYGGTDAVRGQQLTIGGAAVPLDPTIRSYTFTPTTTGTLPIALDASSALTTRRRAAGDPAPPASSCSTATRALTLTIGPRCVNPTAVISGGGTACGAVEVIAEFTGTPPFSGRWSDGVSFTTTHTHLARTITTSGVYTLDRFEDAACVGRISGSVAATVLADTRITDLSVSPAAVAVFSNNGRITLGFENVSGCTLRSALGNFFTQYACTASGTTSTTYVPENDVGAETITFRVTGPCGADERTQPWFVCGHNGELSASGPTTFCKGGSVTLTASVVGTSAGPPYQGYRFYRCPYANAQCGDPDWTLVQAGSANTYVATESGNYGVAVVDRLGCPGLIGGSARVTVNTCP